MSRINRNTAAEIALRINQKEDERFKKEAKELQQAVLDRLAELNTGVEKALWEMYWKEKENYPNYFRTALASIVDYAHSVKTIYLYNKMYCLDGKVYVSRSSVQVPQVVITIPFDSNFLEKVENHNLAMDKLLRILQQDTEMIYGIRTLKKLKETFSPDIEEICGDLLEEAPGSFLPVNYDSLKQKVSEAAKNSVES